MSACHLRKRINWGDCDAAGITFYPNYFAWFDESTWHLFAAHGLDCATLMEDWGVYLPLLEAKANFRQAGFLGDELTIESSVVEWRDKVFRVTHTVRRGDEVVLEGTELRCWAQRREDEPRRLRGASIPADVRARFEEAMAA